MMIYFIQCTGSKRIKIGCTAVPYSRMELLTTNNAYPVELLAAVEGDKYVERAYHDDLLEHRVHSEWFLPAEAVLQRVSEARNGKVLPPSQLKPSGALNWKKQQAAVHGVQAPELYTKEMEA